MRVKHSVTTASHDCLPQRAAAPVAAGDGKRSQVRHHTVRNGVLDKAHVTTRLNDSCSSRSSTVTATAATRAATQATHQLVQVGQHGSRAILR